MPGVAKFVGLVAAGRCTPLLLEAWSCARLTPLKKSGKGGIRPLACVSTWRRFIVGLLCKTHSKTIGERLSPHQHAVGIPAAIESL
eukprot:7373763-Prorocentrum_lima.AAC.1